MNLRNVIATVALGLMGFAAPAAAGDPCFHKGSMYSDGGASCQENQRFRCDNGEWVSVLGRCEDPASVASRNCNFSGIAFSTGSASCQAGTQYRCEDGTWKSLSAPCAVGDSPIRLNPSGQVCMFGGATVANGSTICQSGSTFLCNDGGWTNLGTLCR